MSIKQEMNYDLQPMDGTITISVDDYNTLIEERFELKQQIVKMEEDREKELKELFVLRPSYRNAYIDIKPVEIIKELYGDKLELYGDKLEIDGAEYELNNTEDFNKTIFDAYKEIREEEEED